LKAKFRSFIRWIVVILCCVMIGTGGWLLVNRMEGTPPVIDTQNLGEAIRSSQPLTFSISDPESGLRKIRVVLRKEGKELILREEGFPAQGFLRGGKLTEKECRIPVDLKKMRISDGEAVLEITVQDYSWRTWWNGNRTVLEKGVLIDTHPPKIEVLSQQHYISQGGSNLVIYRLSEPCPKSGVTAGDNFFPGYPAQDVLGPKAENVYLCFVALRYDQERSTPMEVTATDRAGNTTSAGFYYYIKNRAFKHDVLDIPESFLRWKIPEFENQLENGSATAIEKFLEINQKIRAANTGLLKGLSKGTEAKLYWDGPFLRLPNSARRANFADHREYKYNGQSVDKQVHLGIDLASIARSPVPASGNGKVIFTGEVGIYGGTVVIDHGFGLLSLYAHLSVISAKVGQTVSRGDIIGNTGATGMAAGDHLHFSMLVHNTFVNPVEWWDKKWINDNIMLKINEAKKIVGTE